MLCISIDGNSVVHSWHPSAVSGPVANFFLFFFEELPMGYIGEIWFINREQITVFKAIFVFLSLRNTFLYFCQWCLTGPSRATLSYMSLPNVAMIVTVKTNLWFLGIGSQSGKISVKSVQAETKHALQRAAKWVERTPDLFLRRNNFKFQSENLTLTSTALQIRPLLSSFTFLPNFHF